jgi:hypothetical protein
VTAATRGERIGATLGIVLGIGLFANGLFMLVDPANWYFAAPASPPRGRSTSISCATSA